MLSQLMSVARSGIFALAAVASVPAAAPAAPLGPSFIPAVADSGALNPTLVQGNGRDRGPGYVWRRNYRGGGNWAGGNWNNGRAYRNYGGYGRHYGGYGRHYGGYGRRWHGNGWGGSGFALGLGFGIPLGYYGGGYYNNYYNPYYGDPYYAAPAYRPRVYRGGGSTHVEWCYNRYRSYRAWDNTFQPYNGPRQQCYSPYS